MIIALTMFANVWLVIWPNQKIVIANASRVLQGGEPLPEAAKAGRLAGMASRQNTFFSIPMKERGQSILAHYRSYGTTHFRTLPTLHRRTRNSVTARKALHGSRPAMRKAKWCRWGRW